MGAVGRKIVADKTAIRIGSFELESNGETATTLIKVDGALIGGVRRLIIDINSDNPFIDMSIDMAPIFLKRIRTRDRQLRGLARPKNTSRDVGARQKKEKRGVV